MVVCSTSLFSMAPNVTSGLLTNGFSINPMTPLFAPGSLFTPSTAAATLPGLTSQQQQVIQCAQVPSTHTTPNSTPPPVNCNVLTPPNMVTYTSVPPSSTTPPMNCVLPPPNIVTYTPVPPNFMPITANCVVPYSPSRCKLPSTPPSNANLYATSSMSGSAVSIYPCNTAIPPPTLVSCQPKVVNATTSVLQCTPGVCQMYPTTVIPSSTGIIPPQKICAVWKQSYGMEHVWQNEFQSYFQQYPHFWVLLPADNPPSGWWHSNVDSAKVRFCCEGCGHGWTSMKGRVAFWFVLDPLKGEGMVFLKLYGQQCDRCKNNNYEPAMWYPEEVKKVLRNIYNRVGEVYYGFHQIESDKSRRSGKPRTPHNSQLCQACKDGVCSERR